MAAYDYLCRTCDRIVEVRASFQQKSEGLRPSCPSCKGEDLRRLFTPVSIAAGAGPGRAPAPTAGGGCCGGGCGCG